MAKIPLSTRVILLWFENTMENTLVLFVFKLVWNTCLKLHIWGWQSVVRRVNPKNNIYSSLSFSLWKFQFLQNFYRKNQFFLATISRNIVSFSTLSCSKSLMAVYKGKRNSRCKSFSMIHFDCVVESTDKLAHKAIV